MAGVGWHGPQLLAAVAAVSGEESAVNRLASLPPSARELDERRPASDTAVDSVREELLAGFRDELAKAVAVPVGAVLLASVLAALGIAAIAVTLEQLV